MSKDNPEEITVATACEHCRTAICGICTERMPADELREHIKQEHPVQWQHMKDNYDGEIE